MAMVVAGFTGGEAEELRRAMGFKRSMERMQNDRSTRLRAGMAARGITAEVQDQIVQSITSFALYGFPESHAASFALIAYASAYLKAHHPTAFTIALLNAWPMGFYHPATLIKDAQRHGVGVHPIDVQHSDWRCTWETSPGSLGHYRGRRAAGSMRLGLRYVRGLRAQVGERIAAERQRQPFESASDLAARCQLGDRELQRLAHGGALASFGLTRRQALWQAARLSRPAGPLFEGEPARGESPLPEMSPLEETVADFQTSGMSPGPHPIAYARAELKAAGVTPNGELPKLRAGTRVRFAGSVIVRQRPGTAKGMLFVTLEDETGMAQALVTPDLLQDHRRLIVSSPGLVIEGILQKKDGSLSIKAENFWSIDRLQETPSHDFR